MDVTFEIGRLTKKLSLTWKALDEIYQWNPLDERGRNKDVTHNICLVKPIALLYILALAGWSEVDGWVDGRDLRLAGKGCQ